MSDCRETYELEQLEQSMNSEAQTLLVGCDIRSRNAANGCNVHASFAQSSYGRSPTANFGPGDPLLAHAAAERVDRSDLSAVFVALEALLS